MMKIRNSISLFVGIVITIIACNTSNQISNGCRGKLDTTAFNAWKGNYVSDSLYLEYNLRKSNAEDSGWYSSNYALYKLSLRLDSTVFTLDDGNVVAELKSFGYYCKVNMYNDTIYLTTFATISYMYDDLENLKPIKKPVVKIFKKNGKILAVAINYTKRVKNYLNPDYFYVGDTIELYKVNHPLRHIRHLDDLYIK